MAFHGSFRIHELLSRHSKKYDPTNTLLGCDINLRVIGIDGVQEEVMMVRLKSPKEDKLLQGVIVELFSTGTFSCPISAYKKWRAVSKMAASKSGPVFRLPGGSCLTGDQFNKEIKAMLGKHINYDEKRYLSHSSRYKMVFSSAQLCFKF